MASADAERLVSEQMPDMVIVQPATGGGVYSDCSSSPIEERTKFAKYCGKPFASVLAPRRKIEEPEIVFVRARDAAPDCAPRALIILDGEIVGAQG